MTLQENTISCPAYGKINLGLDVVRRLENGYHQVRMIMQTVSLHDMVHIKMLEEDCIVVATNSGKIPTDENNLAYKAAKLLKENYGIKKGVEIFIEKNIPVAAGMAGGSTDCAAVLKGMNQLFGLGLSSRELRSEGVKLGADVPYCIMGGTALSEGIGEVLTPLCTPPACIVLLAKPDVDVSTRYVYQNLKLDQLKSHPDIDGMQNAIERQDLQELCSKMSNVLETVTGEKYPVIGKIEACMKEAGALQSIMSGSGPTVFGIFTDEEKAKRGAEAICAGDYAKEVYISSFQS